MIIDENRCNRLQQMMGDVGRSSVVDLSVNKENE